MYYVGDVLILLWLPACKATGRLSASGSAAPSAGDKRLCGFTLVPAWALQRCFRPQERACLHGLRIGVLDLKSLLPAGRPG